MSRFLIGAAIAGLVWVSPEPAHAEKKPNDKQIGELVKQLGDPQFKVREEAHRALVEIGRPALPQLQKATRDVDVEIQERARRVIRAIEKPAPPKKANVTVPIAAVASARTITVTKANQENQGVEFTLTVGKHPDPSLDTLYVKVVLPRKGKLDRLDEVLVQIKDGDALNLRVPLAMKKDDGVWTGGFHMTPAQAKKCTVNLVCPSPVPTSVTTYEVQLGTYFDR